MALRMVTTAQQADSALASSLRRLRTILGDGARLMRTFAPSLKPTMAVQIALRK